MKNTWSNRIEETGGATTIILFDTLNTSGARNYGSMDLLPLVAQAAAKKRAEYAAFSMPRRRALPKRSISTSRPSNTGWPWKAG